MISFERIKVKTRRHVNTPAFSQISGRYHRHFAKALGLVNWYFVHPDYFMHSGLYFSNIEFSVTTNCTLRCKHCAHFINRYEKEPFTPDEILIKDLRKLLDSIEWVDEFRVLGGEPLLYPKLAEIISFLLTSDKIGMIEIVTNGTISPTKELIGLFPDKRLNISVSNYGALSGKLDEFASNSRISTTISAQEITWLDHGDLTCRNRKEAELRKQFARCCRERCILLNGKLFYCATSAYGSDLGAFEIGPDEYVNLRSDECVEDLRKQLQKLKKRKFFTACNYCTWGTDLLVPIKAAEQESRPGILIK